MCVFEDKLLRYGPFLAWAAVQIESITPTSTRTGKEANAWFEGVIQQGMDELRDFEEGRVEAYSSLQSVLWNLLCKKTGCNLADSWDKALEIIEREMASYKIE